MSSLCAHKYPSDFLLTYGEVGSFSLTGSKDERQKLRRCASVSEAGLTLSEVEERAEGILSEAVTAKNVTND
jgi:hypothetical protein